MFSTRSPARAFRSSWKSSLPLCAGLLLAACSGGSTKDSQRGPSEVASSPIGDAYGALEHADYDALPGVIDALDAAVAQDAEDERSTFYAGVMRLWRVAERQSHPEYTTAELAADTQGALDDLDRARKLDPTDAHAAAFYGITQVNVGKLAGDDERIDLGRQTLADAVALYPAYVHGVRALAFGALPREHRYFPDAADGLSGSASACGLDSESASGKDVAYPEGQQPRERGACNDLGIVAHVWEGFFLTYGDVMVKQGDAAAGRAAYENAKASPAYERWLLKDVLDRRIDEAEQRAALYQDGDPSNDPPTWMDEGQLCTGCHASTR